MYIRFKQNSVSEVSARSTRSLWCAKGRAGQGSRSRVYKRCSLSLLQALPSPGNLVSQHSALPAQQKNNTDTKNHLRAIGGEMETGPI